MTAIDGFLSTWSNARQTFGEGSPQSGEQYDQSGKLTNLQSTVQTAAPSGNWTGSAADAYAKANTRHGEVLGQMAGLDKRLAAEVNNSARAVATGRQNLDALRQWVVDAANSVPPGKNADQIKIQIAQKGLTQLQDILKQSNAESNAIGGRIQKLGDEYQALGDQIFKKGGGEGDEDGPIFATGDESMGPVPPEQQAKEDVERTLKDGDPEASTRVERVLDSIKPYHELSAEQAAYLNEMQRQQHDMSVNDLKAAEERLGDKGHIIGDSWQLMSNDDVPRQAGPFDQQEGRKGGFDRLPQSVQDAIKSPIAVPVDNQLNDIAAIVKGGHQELQTGTELDREMMRRADRIMDTPLFTDGSGFTGHEKADFLDNVVQNIFDSAGRDHQIVHDQITGIKGDDGQDFLNDITHHEWKDDGKAAGSLFSWTGEEAMGPNVKIAAETASVYANYIGTHDSELLDLNDQTIGDMNPNLVQGMSEGLTPYIPNIAGMSEGQLPGFETPDKGAGIEEGQMPIAKGIFSVMSTDDKAGALFNGVAQHQAVLANERFAEDFRNHVPGVSSHSADLNDSATLQGLVDAGLHNALSHEKLNGIELEQKVFEAKSAAFDMDKNIVGTLGGKLPIVGELVGPGLDVFGQAAKDAIVGTAPGVPTTDANGNYVAPDMSASAANAQIIGALVSQGVEVPGVPANWVVHEADGGSRIMSYAEVQQMSEKADIPAPSYSDYNETLGVAAENTLGTDLANNVEGALKDRYNQVSEDLDPQNQQPNKPEEHK